MLSSEDREGILFLHCHADVVYERAEEFRFEMFRLLFSRPSKVVLDLENARYLCSTALGTIASAYGQVKEAGGQMVLSSLTPEVARLLNVTRLSAIIPVANDSDEAATLLLRPSEGRPELRAP